MREEMMLTQTEFGRKLKVSTITIKNWEKGYTQPKPAYMHYILALYEKNKKMRITAQEIKQIRTSRGLIQEEFAKALGIGACTVDDWEHGRHEIRAVHRRKIYDFCMNTK